MEKQHIHPSSVGIVETQYYTFEELILTSGLSIKDVTIAYETYGSLNKERSNAILITHALSGNAHAAGYHSEGDKYPGWWELYIGPGKPFDTDKYFIISSNVIGGCDGSTGPSTINPDSKKPFGLRFPMVTIEDMVLAQKKLIEHLKIDTLLSVAGGSMGGMQALKWSILFPEICNSIICIAASASLSAQGIALNEVGRQAIINDPHWNNGDYYDGKPPDAGLSLARMIAHITYLSENLMHEKFGRRFQNSVQDAAFNASEFMVESYLHYQGIKFVNRFDANAYMYITKAIDYFDLERDYGSLMNAFEKVLSNFLIISFTSDWLYTEAQSRNIVKALRANGKNIVYANIETDKGHDAFLIKNEPLENMISNFLLHQIQ